MGLQRPQLKLTEETMATKKNAAKKPIAAKHKKNKLKATTGKTSAAKKRSSPNADVPIMFRLNVEVGNIDEAAEFYEKLFGIAGRKQDGSRCYFSCGPVQLQVGDVVTPRKANH